MTARRRPTATVVIPAWNAWEHTRACLTSLHPTLGDGDRTVVVDNGSTDGTGAALRRFPWVEVVTNEVNQGFARGCNQGAAVAGGDVVVFLNSDTVLPDGWLDELLAPFVDPTVGATGPRSDNVSGWQQVPEAPDPGRDPEGFRAFAGEWRRRHRGRTTDVERLVGFCLAVRRSTLEALGGFDERYETGGYEDDDLCRRIRERGERLLIAEGSFVHHACHASFDDNDVDWARVELENRARYLEKWDETPEPLLSACLIVKDEERLLPACLASLRDVVDEIVVHDTGSTDGTVAIARAAGAVVVEGRWEDSFAEARNVALAHARGTWILSIDADETLQVDPSALRALLEGVDPEVEAFLTPIENLHGAGNARSVHTALRVFRRRGTVWRHRIHEQITPADDPTRSLHCSYLSSGRLIHHGYEAEVFAGRNKAERNLELARQAVEDGEQSRPYAAMNYGRALQSVGRVDEAIEYLTEAQETTGDPITRRLATLNLINLLINLGRCDEALGEVAKLRRFSRSQVPADIAEGRARIAAGDAARGLAILARVPVRARDDDGMEYGPHTLAAIRGEALASLGRFGEAADVVLEAVRTEGVLEADLGELARWLTEAGRSPEEITTGLRVEDLVPVLGRVLRQPPALADLLLSGACERFPDRLEPLAAGARIAPGLPVARALLWSARLRARGLADACPLLVMAANPEIDPLVGLRSAAACYGTFGADPRLVTAATAQLDRLDGTARTAAEEEVGRMAPGLLTEVRGGPVTGAAPVISTVGPTAAPAPVAVAVPAPAPAVVPLDTSRVLASVPGLATRRSGATVAATPRRGGVNVVAPFEGTTAEADVGRRLATALRVGGIPSSTTSYLRDPGDDPVAWEHADDGDYPFDTNLLVVHPEDLTDFILDLGPASFEGRYVVGLWLWDAATPSPAMADAAAMVHEVWVPSPAAAAAVASVASVPVHAVPLPVGDRPAPLDRAAWGLPAGPLLATTVDFADGARRQNATGAVRAFTDAFAPGEGPHLVVATRRGDRYPEEYDEVVAAAAGRADVTVLDRGGWTPDDHDALVAEASGLLALARADASLLDVAKAAAWGTPVVTTDGPTARAVLGRRAALLVPAVTVEVPEDEYRYRPGTRWSEPDPSAAAEAVRSLLEDPEATAGRVRAAAAVARRTMGPEVAARAVGRRLAAVARRRYGVEVAGGRHAGGRARPGGRVTAKGTRGR